ncbi:MAG: hypothetical protein JWN08_1997 [Frankiales bacterium]|nr:hypothetical protein [Frankiales bacterium]
MTSTADRLVPRTDTAPVNSSRQHGRGELAASGQARQSAGTLVIAAGLILGLSGAGAWAFVQSSLAGENITVAEDAARFGGQQVNGPLTAYYEADVIEDYALEVSGGKTYAELGREDPVRATVVDGSSLRASLFTCVVSFGIAAMAMGSAIIFVLIGFALRAVRSPSTA